jgi:hypothetical protein
MRLSPAIEFLLKHPVIRPSQKLVSETILPAAIETEESGDRTIDVEGSKVVVIHRPRRRGANDCTN